MSRMPACGAPVAGARSCGSIGISIRFIWCRLDSFAFGMRSIHPEPSIELGEPLAVHECLQNAAHLEPIGGAAKPTQESHLNNTVYVRIDPLQEPNLVCGVGQEQSHHLGYFVAAQDQSGVAAGGVELHQLFSQQCQEETDLVSELPAGHEARQVSLALLRGSLSQIGIT